MRDELRDKIGRFVEVYTRCSLEALRKRDPKGLYAKADAGEIPNFTGVSDPYEEPDKPEVVCDTESESIDESVEKILRTLELIGYISASESEEEDYSPEEGAKIKKRLQELGYI